MREVAKVRVGRHSTEGACACRYVAAQIRVMAATTELTVMSIFEALCRLDIRAIQRSSGRASGLDPPARKVSRRRAPSRYIFQALMSMPTVLR